MGFELLESAIRRPEPDLALRALVKKLAVEGQSKAEITLLLEAFVLHLRSRPGDHEHEEDRVLDILDALNGWCHPTARLLD